MADLLPEEKHEPDELDLLRSDSERDEQLSLLAKLGYGVGTLPQTATNVIGFFWNRFLLEVALLSPTYVGTALLVAKLWDAFVDPTVGVLTDRTHSRWGRRRPWLLFAAPLTGVAFFTLWLTPAFDETGRFVFFFCMYCVQQTIASCYYVPYASLTMDIATTARNRNSLTQYRFLTGGFGALVFVALMGVVTNQAAPENEARAYQLCAIIIGVIMAGAGLLCFFGVREKDYEQLKTEQPKSPPVLRGLLNVVRNKEYVIIVTLTAVGWLSLQLIQVNLQLYVAYALNMNSYFTYGLLLALLLGSILVPVARIITNKYGKKVAWCVGVVCMWAFSLTAYFAPANNVAMVFVVSVLFGWSVAILYYVPWALLPDVIDLEELNTGIRQEGTYYSFFGLFEKIMAAVGIALSNYILGLAGYDASNPENNATVVAPVIRSIVAFGPLILMTLSLGILYIYPINYTREREIQARILTKRANGKGEQTSLLSSSTPAVATDQTAA